jgi:hypothetical protein
MNNDATRIYERRMFLIGKEPLSFNIIVDSGTGIICLGFFAPSENIKAYCKEGISCPAHILTLSITKMLVRIFFSSSYIVTIANRYKCMMCHISFMQTLNLNVNLMIR